MDIALLRAFRVPLLRRCVVMLMWAVLSLGIITLRRFDSAPVHQLTYKLTAMHSEHDRLKHDEYPDRSGCLFLAAALAVVGVFVLALILYIIDK